LCRRQFIKLNVNNFKLFEQKGLKFRVFAKVSAAKNLSIEPTRDEAFFGGKNLD
jgi:hypothetical protein